MHLVNDYFDQPPPLQEHLLGKADDVSSHLVFSPNETIMHSEVLVCIQIREYFCKDRVYTIVSSHNMCKVHLSFYACA